MRKIKQMHDCLYIFGSLITFVGGINIYTSSSFTSTISGIIMLTIGILIMYCGYLLEGVVPK